MALYSSYIAIGDSFSEGYGDEGLDGVPRGWADFVALGLARPRIERRRDLEFGNCDSRATQRLGGRL